MPLSMHPSSAKAVIKSITVDDPPSLARSFPRGSRTIGAPSFVRPSSVANLKNGALSKYCRDRMCDRRRRREGFARHINLPRNGPLCRREAAIVEAAARAVAAAARAVTPPAIPALRENQVVAVAIMGRASKVSACNGHGIGAAVARAKHPLHERSMTMVEEKLHVVPAEVVDGLRLSKVLPLQSSCGPTPTTVRLVHRDEYECVGFLVSRKVDAGFLSRDYHVFAPTLELAVQAVSAADDELIEMLKQAANRPGRSE